MPSVEPLFVIAFSELSRERGEVVQELVKEKCNGWWWHNFPDLWIVGGGSADYWRDFFKPVIRGTASEVLVLRLADTGVEWASMGLPSRYQWLHDAFGTRRSIATPPDED